MDAAMPWHTCLATGEQVQVPFADCPECSKRAPRMDFSEALIALKSGGKVARDGWNGKGMFLYHVLGSTFNVNRPPLLGIYPEGTQINYRGHIDMRTVDGSCVPWVASQTDLLADDWHVVE